MPTKIDWADEVWNPITGCTKTSDGCKNCYAQRMATRLAGRCGYDADEPFKPTFHADKLELPLKWKQPRRVFVNSMGDLLHVDVQPEWLQQAFAVMRRAYWHKFLILTKRPENHFRKLISFGILDAIRPEPNIWWGVSVEDQQSADARIPRLLHIPAAVRFVSAEPLLEYVDISVYLRELDWVICGGETGPGARPMHPRWAHFLKRQSEAAKVSFFFKGFGAWSPICSYYGGPFASADADEIRDKAMDDPHILLDEDGCIFDESVGQPYSTCHIMRRTRTKEMKLYGREYTEFPEDCE